MNRPRRNYRQLADRAGRFAGVVYLLAALGCTGPGREDPPADEQDNPTPQTRAQDTRDRPAFFNEAIRRARARPAGYWNFIDDPAGRALTEEEREELAAIGYLAGVEHAPALVGVTQHDPERAQAGYNLYCTGHGPEAFLTDMDGVIVHTWRFDASELYPVEPRFNYYRRVHLFDDGSLLAMVDPHGIIRLDKDSNLVWATRGSIFIHHDMHVQPDGTIFALGRGVGRDPEISEHKTIIEDYVVRISSEGEIIDSFPIREAFRKSPYWEEIKPRIVKRMFIDREEFHTNTIQVFGPGLESVSPLLKPGNMMFCSPWYQNVWIIDPGTQAVVWNWHGPWENGIHEAHILETGNLLIYDNHHSQNPVEGLRSKAAEYTFPEGELVWEYLGDESNPASTFFSGSSSSVERLPNGNTLIVVTENGRAIEVTHDKDVVWEFYNPKRAGDRQQFIASLFQLDRIPAEKVVAWLTPLDGATRR